MQKKYKYVSTISEILEQCKIDYFDEEKLI